MDEVRAKGVKRSVAANYKYEQFKKIIFADELKDMRTVEEFDIIKSRGHVLRSEKIRKVGLSCFDDKFYYVTNTFSLPYGHYKIAEIEKHLEENPQGKVEVNEVTGKITLC